MKQIITQNNEIYHLITPSEHYEKTKNISDEEKKENFIIVPEENPNDAKSNNYYEKIYGATPAEQAIISAIDSQNEMLKTNNQYLKELVNICNFFKILALVAVVIGAVSVIIQLIR